MNKQINKLRLGIFSFFLLPSILTINAVDNIFGSGDTSSLIIIFSSIFYNFVLVFMIEYFIGYFTKGNLG